MIESFSSQIDVSVDTCYVNLTRMYGCYPRIEKALAGLSVMEAYQRCGELLDIFQDEDAEESQLFQGFNQQEHIAEGRTRLERCVTHSCDCDTTVRANATWFADARFKMGDALWVVIDGTPDNARTEDSLQVAALYGLACERNGHPELVERQSWTHADITCDGETIDASFTTNYGVVSIQVAVLDSRYFAAMYHKDGTLCDSDLVAMDDALLETVVEFCRASKDADNTLGFTAARDALIAGGFRGLSQRQRQAGVILAAGFVDSPDEMVRRLHSLADLELDTVLALSRNWTGTATGLLDSAQASVAA